MTGVGAGAERGAQCAGRSIFIENIAPGLMNTVVFFSAPIRQDRAAAAQGFTVALMRAARDLQGEAAKSDEHLRILSPYTRLGVDVLRASAFNAWDPDLTIQQDGLMDQQLVHIQHARTEFAESIPPERLIDDRFQAAALQRLDPAAPDERPTQQHRGEPACASS